MTVTGYIRVSTTEQSFDHWRIMIRDYAIAQGLPEPVWLEENVSGSKGWQQRKLGPWLAAAAPGDVLIVGEASRIGRDAHDALGFVKAAKAKGVELHIRPLDPIRPGDGPDSATLILPVLFGMAEYEREQLRYRTRLGLARAKAEGKKLGGYRGTAYQGTRSGQHHPDKERILRAVRAGGSINGTAARFGVSRTSIYRWMKEAS